VLDKGVVIAGDIKINLLDIELLTVKLRLLVASVDKAKEMGIDWWEHDPALSSRAMKRGDEELEEENRLLRERIAALEEGRAPRVAADGRADASPEDAAGSAARGGGASGAGADGEEEHGQG
jgi:hypothetical protein